MDPDPTDAQDLQDAQDALPQTLMDAMRDPARRDRTVEVDGTGFRLRFDPEHGVDMRLEAVEAPDEARYTTYHAVDERPASYPAELPFLPRARASVSGRTGNAAVQWWNVPDVEGALAELRAQGAAGGWTEGAETGLDVLPGFRMLGFERADGLRRMVQVASTGNGTMIQLLHARG